MPALPCCSTASGERGGAKLWRHTCKLPLKSEPAAPLGCCHLPLVLGAALPVLSHSLRPPVLRVHQCLLLLGHHGSDCLMLRRLPHLIIIFQSLACLLVLLHCWGCLLTRPNVFVFAFISWCVLLSNIGWDMCRGLNLWRGLETDLWRELRGGWVSRGNART